MGINTRKINLPESELASSFTLRWHLYNSEHVNCLSPSWFACYRCDWFHCKLDCFLFKLITRNYCFYTVSVCLDFPTYLPHFVSSVSSFISDHVTGITRLLCDIKPSVYGHLTVPLFPPCPQTVSGLAGCSIWGWGLPSVVEDMIPVAWFPLFWWVSCQSLLCSLSFLTGAFKTFSCFSPSVAVLCWI